MLLILAAAEDGEPLSVSADDLRARLDAIVKQVRAERGCWNENQRGEYRRIGEALEAARRIFSLDEPEGSDK